MPVRYATHPTRRVGMHPRQSTPMRDKLPQFAHVLRRHPNCRTRSAASSHTGAQPGDPFRHDSGVGADRQPRAWGRTARSLTPDDAHVARQAAERTRSLGRVRHTRGSLVWPRRCAEDPSRPEARRIPPDCQASRFLCERPSPATHNGWNPSRWRDRAGAAVGSRACEGNGVTDSV